MLTYRFVLPTLTLTALSLAFTAGAQAQQKKPATPASSSRPAAGATAPSSTTPQAAAPAPAPIAVAAAPVVVAKPATPEPRPSKAAPKGQRPHVGFQGALAAPMSSLGKAFTAGYTAGGFVEGKPAALPVGLRGDLQYTRFPGKTTGIDTAYTAIQLTGAAVYEFPNSTGGKSPFFSTVGLGLYRWSLNGSGQTDFGQNLGLGFKFRGVKFNPLLEGRFHFFNDVQYFTFTAGFHL